MTYTQLWQSLTPLYDAGEAHAIVRMVLEDRFGISMNDLLCDGTSKMSEGDLDRLVQMMNRLRNAEPVQYVLSEAWFMGRRFHVEPGVLIPRPETEILCQWVMDDHTLPRPEILDIGCGSGCIAVTLALEIAGSAITAYDISPKALDVTERNALALGAGITIEKQDALHLTDNPHRWDVIVSNPPYICHNEREAMHVNVTRYEPEEALYVPDDAPLLFYTAIADYAATSLRPGGKLYFECNPLYLQDITAMLASKGFSTIKDRDDQFGKKRFIQATRP